MTSSDQGAQLRRYGLLALAILLLVLGGTALFIGASRPAIRPIGIGAVLISVYVIRISNARGRSVLGAGGNLDFKPTKSPDRLLWIVSAALVPISVAAVLYLMNDAAHGYHEVLPVYIFAGVATVCAAVWSYLVSQIR